MLRAVLFDFDGTIADSEFAHLSCWNELLAPFDVRIEVAFYGPVCAGTRTEEIARRIVSHHPAVTASAADLTVQKDALYDAWVAAHDVPAMPGAIELVKHLATLDLEIGLVTGAADASVRKTLATHGLLDCFATRVTHDDVARGKPAPDSYLLALERLGVSASEAVALEDTSAGAASAKAAGIRTIAVPNAYTATHDFSMADAVIADLFVARSLLSDWMAQ